MKPWAMTRGNYMRWYENEWKNIPVPAEVLADYPDEEN